MKRRDRRPKLLTAKIAKNSRKDRKEERGKVMRFSLRPLRDLGALAVKGFKVRLRAFHSQIFYWFFVVVYKSPDPVLQKDNMKIDQQS